MVLPLFFRFLGYTKDVSKRLETSLVTLILTLYLSPPRYQVLFAGDGGDSELISCSDDKTVRFWDARSGQETHRVALGGAPGGMELAGDMLTVAQGNKVTFFDAKR